MQESLVQLFFDLLAFLPAVFQKIEARWIGDVMLAASCIQEHTDYVGNCTFLGRVIPWFRLRFLLFRWIFFVQIPPVRYIRQLNPCWFRVTLRRLLDQVVYPFSSSTTIRMMMPKKREELIGACNEKMSKHRKNGCKGSHGSSG